MIPSNSTVTCSVLQNKLLALLPDEIWQRLQRHLSLLEVRAGEILGEPYCRLDHCYFPISSIVSMQHVAADGASTEVAAIGNEGLVGVDIFLGDGSTPNRVIVQSGGLIYRLKRDFLEAEFSRGRAVQHLLLRYTQALLAQISQRAVCNQRHSVDQQLCRWLLQSADRLGSAELTMTHELLGNTLGMRREGITAAAHKLLIGGLIAYRRGRISIINRAGIEACCCECYAVIRHEHDRVTGAYCHSLPRWTDPACAVPLSDHPASGRRDNHIGALSGA